MFDINKIRNDFPILSQKVNNKPLVYLDNAATTQKPRQVIDAVSNYYETINSNIHRGVHHLSQLATAAYEEARIYVADYINAKHPYEVIFTRGTTESINLVASAFGKRYLGKGDEIIISTMEHHSNIVPWQLMCSERDANIKVIPINNDGTLDLEAYKNLLNDKTKLVSITHISNALGTINPIEDIIRIAHEHNIPVLIDGAQAISHLEVDVQKLDCDFYCFSGHKVYAPMGIGVLYGKKCFLNEMPPYQGGGEMIKEVSFEKTTFNDLPFKFEAGTPNVSDVIGLHEALKYINAIGIEQINIYEHELLKYAEKKLIECGDIILIGTAEHKTGVVSFLIKNAHPYDVGTLLDKMGIAVRTGHHCAQPLMKRFNIPGTIRASFAIYNTKEEVDSLINSINIVKQMLL